ncbi:MAG: hypothetical protein OXU45_09950, partial [Candidatus Melainabacteria bacterium]|nr:hypothetical protein [Candidatus Melainabacteria bacterium]
IIQLLPVQAWGNKCVDDYTELVDLVAEPKKYLGKKINIKGSFHSFGSLVLDYKKAMRSSKDYVGLVLARPDEQEIPLVELKLAAPLKMFKEEDINIKHDDEVSIRAKVFAMVLGEPWLDVESIELLEKENG